MPTPALFAGTWSEPHILRIGSGYDDDGESYELYAKTEPLAPAGAGGEAMFTLLYLTTRHYDSNVSFWITPIVDGVALETRRINLVGVTSSQGELQTHEVGLSVAHLEGGVEVGRNAPRGIWFQVLVETRYGSNGGTPSDQIIESVELEYEVVRETATDTTATA